MKCPICDYDGITSELRCPKCAHALTLWKNYDAYARRMYETGLAMAEGDPASAALAMLQAVVFAPQEPRILAACGAMFGRLGRHSESAWFYKRSHQLDPRDDVRAELEKALQCAAGNNPTSATPTDKLTDDSDSECGTPDNTDADGEASAT